MVGRGLRLAAPLFLLCALAALLLPAGGRASGPAVAVFPIPGARVAAPTTQITFRGIPIGQVGSIAVTGSQSGVHTGTLQSDSDGNGGSFLPSTPFKAGETVTVQTSLNILNGNNGTFSFNVANPAPSPPVARVPVPFRVSGDVQRYRSRPDLSPATVKVLTRRRGVAGGDIFVSPQYGPVQDGPMILDPYGTLLWFKPLPPNESAGDFRTQTYHGQPVLTWWQGYVGAGVGLGFDVINDSSYRQIDEVRAGNGLVADGHEFQLTPQGTALITAYYPVYWDASSIRGGPKTQVTFDSVVQEIDIPTGLVLFQWDSLDHVPVNATYSGLPSRSTSYFDYFHVNSIDLDDDGNLVIGARNTWAAYKVSHQTGAMIWELGGRSSSFKLARGTYWAFQHDVRVRAQNDQFVTLFDDSAGPPTVHNQSRAVKLQLDLTHMTARQVSAYSHSPPLSANFEGNVEQLSNGDDFVGWGMQPYFSEYNSRGQMVFDAHFLDFDPSARAFRLPWSGTPATPPALAVSARGAKATAYASWNGATHVMAWRVVGGSSTKAMKWLGAAYKHSFETAINVHSQRYMQVLALDWGHRIIGASPVVAG